MKNLYDYCEIFGKKRLRIERTDGLFPVMSELTQRNELMKDIAFYLLSIVMIQDNEKITTAFGSLSILKEITVYADDKQIKPTATILGALMFYNKASELETALRSH